MKKDPEWTFEDLIKIKVFVKRNILNLRDTRRIMQCIKDIMPSLLPHRKYRGKSLLDSYSYKESMDIDLDSLTRKIIEGCNKSRINNIELEGGSRKWHCYMNIWSSKEEDRGTISISIEKSAFYDDLTWNGLKALFRRLVLDINAIYGFISTKEELDYKEYFPKNDLQGFQIGRYRPAIRQGEGLYSIFSINYFGEEYLNLFGKTRINSLRDLIEIEWLNGQSSFIISIGDSPLDWRIESNLILCGKIQMTLDNDIFFDPKNPSRVLKAPIRSILIHDLFSDIQSTINVQKVGKPMIDEFKHSAETFIRGSKAIFDEQMNYDSVSLHKLDRLIKEGWGNRKPEILEEVITSFGSFLGETLIRIYGGEWIFESKIASYGVKFSKDIIIFPFEKMKKRFMNGETDSISDFLRLLEFKLLEAPTNKF